LEAIAASGQIELSVDHILPRVQGGVTTFENVCLACRASNEFKSTLTEAVDPLTGETVPLFHPRQQSWADHFAWSEDCTWLGGKTPVGRATVLALQMNRPVIVVARRRWVSVGWHPPTD
jgi:5-methylcytosine-specific restriction endonuclease McrA